jgi:transcriptional antiterminator NusG
MSENSQEEPRAAASDAKPASGDKRWYVVHAYSGMEKSVRRSLLERIERMGMSDRFGEILVPTEDVVEVKGGQKTVTERRYFPGYILVEMEMTDETWHLVRNTPKITGFIGGKSNRPTPVPAHEMEKLLQQMQEGVDKPRPKISYEVGELVRIKEGPFADFNGNVGEVNYEKSRLWVHVTIFGRSTPVELEFGQVEKV